MGIIWSLEVISFFFDHPIWYITDAANALHGVFIFVIFVLKKKVIRVCRFANIVPSRKSLGKGLILIKCQFPYMKLRCRNRAAFFSIEWIVVD